MYNLNANSPLTSSTRSPDLNTLANKIMDNNCVLFAGAGISYDSGLPSWHELLEDLAKIAEGHDANKDDISHVRELIKRKDYIMAAEMLQRSLGVNRSLILSRTQDLMRSRSKGPNPLHFLLTRLGFSSIVTTNYDDLLERASSAFTHTENYSTVAARDAGTASDDRRCIIKLHGSTDDSPESIVLTRSAYNSTYGGSAVNDWLRSRLISKSFIFAGYSLSDFDLLSLVREARASAPTKIGPHFAILDSKSVRPAYSDYLRECYNIESVLVDIHQDGLRNLLIQLHGMLAVRHSEAKSFTLQPAECLANAIELLCKRIRRAFGVDSLTLYMVDGVDSRTLRRWSDSDPQMSSRLGEQAHADIAEFFYQMRDINYYYAGRTGNGSGTARNLFLEHVNNKSVMALPVVSQGKKWGLLVISSKVPEFMTEDHMRALRAFARAIADTYIEFKSRNDSVKHLAEGVTFDFIREVLNTSRIVKQASAKNELDYILYTIDYDKGQLRAHCDERHVEAAKLSKESRVRIVNGAYTLRMENKHLSVKALSLGSTLRYATPSDALNANPECEKGIKDGFALFGIEGNIYINPIRSFGHISAILVAWSRKKCEDGVFHSTIFDRVKRLARVIMNDPSRHEIRDPSISLGKQFLDFLESNLRFADGGEVWNGKLADLAVRTGIIKATLNSLTHDSTCLKKVRLWIVDGRGSAYLVSGKIQGADFSLRASYSRADAVFDGLPQLDGYVREYKPITTSAKSSEYTKYTVKRFASDPYARFQRVEEFHGPDKNSPELHKDKHGKWLVAPIVWRVTGSKLDEFQSGKNARLLGFLSADSHANVGGVPTEVPQKNPSEQEAFQRCVMDLASHILAPVIHAIVSELP
jgi:hypothetical protein